MSVTAPRTELVPERFRKAPVPPMPVPCTVRLSAVDTPPLNCKAAPLATVVPAAAEPKALEWATVSAPALTLVRPV
ncbi:hypothetical protein LINBF2_13120 [Limnohabitans sp. INBF002]|nr:hypothetical protein LINBF2_13120 [Limnohabitans sp. INBF002]